MAAVSTRGRDSSSAVDGNHFGYVVLHVTVQIHGIEYRTICRFSLYDDELLKRVLRSPASICAIEGDVYDLVYDKLEMLHIVAQKERDDLWLCICSYDLSDSTGERLVRFSEAETEQERTYRAVLASAVFRMCNRSFPPLSFPR
jgi:hypothetical protein